MCFESVVLVPGWTALSRGVPVRAVRLLTPEWQRRPCAPTRSVQSPCSSNTEVKTI